MSALGPHHETDFASTVEESRCPEQHPQLGRCGFFRGHSQPQHGVAVLEDRTLALHLWAGDEVRRLQPGRWGMSKTRLPWAAGYWFDEPPRPTMGR